MNPSVRRRSFLTLLGSAASAWPLAARAQQSAMPVVGLLSVRAADQDQGRMAAFHRGLGEMGFVEGRNVAIEYRWADGQYDRLPAMAADLVRRQVTVIAADAMAATLAAKAATTTIPIVFSTGADPVELGLVATLARPGGNLTGATNLNTEVGPKRLELLRELVPTATTIAVLVNPTSPLAEPQSRGLQAAARTLGLRLHILHASTDRDIDTVFATLADLRTGGLVIGSDAFFTSRSDQLAVLALRHRVGRGEGGTVSQYVDRPHPRPQRRTPAASDRRPRRHHPRHCRSRPRSC
jgi:putative tryptophan/tyrosine transport system substrate-binding protein